MLCQVAVEVELDADHHLWADDLTDPADEIPFAVVVAFGDHGPVEGQEHQVDRQAGFEVRQHLVAQVLVDGANGQSRRLGGGVQAEGELQAACQGELAKDVDGALFAQALGGEVGRAGDVEVGQPGRHG